MNDDEFRALLKREAERCAAEQERADKTAALFVEKHFDQLDTQARLDALIEAVEVLVTDHKESMAWRTALAAARGDK